MRSGVGGRELRANWRVWERWALLGGHVQRAAGMSQVLRAEGGCRVQSAHRGVRCIGYGGLTWGGDVYGGVGRGGWRSELTVGHGCGRCSLSLGGRWAIGTVP